MPFLPCEPSLGEHGLDDTGVSVVSSAVGGLTLAFADGLVTDTALPWEPTPRTRTRRRLLLRGGREEIRSPVPTNRYASLSSVPGTRTPTCLEF
jgi:hypothetical protein